MSWQIDTSHSHVQFAVRHMMISRVRGEFEKFSGTVNLDEANPAASNVEVQIDANSINTRDEQRDTHLRSPDFLNTDQHPYLTFKSTRVEQVDSHHANLHGDLTIRDVTRPVTLDVEYQGRSKSPWGTESYGFNASTKINRKDWGLEWNVALETGGVLVGDEVTIDIELELVKQA
ncbi:MAG: polyisoprenoid-binding protein [Chloroflexi bacterium]|nr:MAG: polyisoprenoid-binding protein [Chloroflexota bacterium]